MCYDRQTQVNRDSQAVGQKGGERWHTDNASHQESTQSGTPSHPQVLKRILSHKLRQCQTDKTRFRHAIQLTA